MSNGQMSEANRRYYNDEMLVRRARVVLEVDVEWRPDDPDYSLSVLQTDAVPDTSVRLLNWSLVDATLEDSEPRQLRGGK